MKGKGLISKDQIESVLQATSLEGLISGYTALKKSGANLLGLCPFHSEKTPSFAVSPSKGTYHCFGCGVSGNAISFVIDIEHYSFVDAVEFLADRAGIPIQRDGSGTKTNSYNEVRGCLDKAQGFYSGRLESAKSGSKLDLYLKARDLSPELIKAFELGWAPEGWTNLHDYLKQKDVPTKVQDSAGLVKMGEKKNWYDRLRDRLIFPIRDVQGRTLGFAGRILGDGEPKYLNPPETELYKKSSVFYGAFEARDAIRRKQKALVVEGYMDVIRLHEKGFDYAVAACGTALNVEHVKALKRLGVKEVELLFDGDKAGQTAAAKAARVFLENDLDGQVTVLPEGLDPDDFFKAYSSANLTELLEKSPYDYRYLLDLAYMEVKDKGIWQQKTKLEELVTLSQEIGSKLKRNLFLGQISKVFGLSLSELPVKRKAEIAQAAQRQATIVSLPSATDLSSAAVEERTLMQYLVSQPRSLGVVRDKVKVEDFGNLHFQELYQRFLNLETEEFQALSPLDLPEVFKEYSSVLMQLVQTGNRFSTESYLDSKASILVDQLLKASARRILKSRFSEEDFELIAKKNSTSRPKKESALTESKLNEANQDPG